jgi:hypothetical protein
MWKSDANAGGVIKCGTVTFPNEVDDDEDRDDGGKRKRTRSEHKETESQRRHPGTKYDDKWRVSTLGNLPITIRRLLFGWLDNLDLACLYVTSPGVRTAVIDYLVTAERVELLPDSTLMKEDVRFSEVTKLAEALPHLHVSRHPRLQLVAQWDGIVHIVERGSTGESEEARIATNGVRQHNYQSSRNRLSQYVRQSGLARRIVSYKANWAAISIELLEILGAGCHALERLCIQCNSGAFSHTTVLLDRPHESVYADALRACISARRASLTTLDIRYVLAHMLKRGCHLTLPDVTDLVAVACRDATVAATNHDDDDTDSRVSTRSSMRRAPCGGLRELRLTEVSECIFVLRPACDWSNLRILSLCVSPIVLYEHEADRIFGCMSFGTVSPRLQQPRVTGHRDAN